MMLYSNIHAKRKSDENMRKIGDKGAPKSVEAKKIALKIKSKHKMGKA